MGQWARKKYKSNADTDTPTVIEYRNVHPTNQGMLNSFYTCLTLRLRYVTLITTKNETTIFFQEYT
jgi:hypothetical protein